jgi:NAD+ synthetase
MQLAIAQLNQVLGDLPANARRILDAAAQARAAGATLIVTPELSLCGYPPEDLILRPGIRRCLRERTRGVGDAGDRRAYCWWDSRSCTKASATMRWRSSAMAASSRSIASNACPTTRFSMKSATSRRAMRHACSTSTVCASALSSAKTSGFPRLRRARKVAGAQVLLVANGSPYHTRQQALRREQAAARAGETGLPIVYVNRVGGQDELVFDGASFVLDADGALAQQLPAWHETVAIVDFDGARPRHVRGALDARLEPHVYDALVMGVRDYVRKNRFPGVLLGLSGGVDSALTLAVAVDALGRDHVRAVMLPSPYNAAISLEDAREMAGILGVRYDEIPIEPVFSAFLESLAPEFRDLAPDAAEENIQARIRGTLLMALSNKFGSIVLTTGNKSEMAVGYATLYGDMAGGFAVLKDIPKTLVYRLCHYRNSLGRVIPERIITRAPVGGIAPGPDGPGFAAALRSARRHPRSLRGARHESRRHRRGRLSRRTPWSRSCGSSS